MSYFIEQLQHEWSADRVYSLHLPTTYFRFGTWLHAPTGCSPPFGLTSTCAKSHQSKMTTSLSDTWLVYVLRTYLQCWQIQEKTYNQERNKGEQEGHNSPGAESLWGCRKIPTMSQVLSSIEYMWFRKISGSNMGRQTCYLPRNKLTSLRPCLW